jgi:hypothetical protein
MQIYNFNFFEVHLIGSLYDRIFLYSSRYIAYENGSKRQTEGHTSGRQDKSTKTQPEWISDLW